MKTKLHRTIALIILQIICVTALTGCTKSTVIDRLAEYNVDTSMFKNYEILCDIKGKTFTGRAPCYAVIAFSGEPTEFINSFSNEKVGGFSSEKTDNIKNQIDEYSSLEIPDKFYPDWNVDYLWLLFDGLDKLYLIYFPNEFKLVIFETGH